MVFRTDVKNRTKYYIGLLTKRGECLFVVKVPDKCVESDPLFLLFAVVLAYHWKRGVESVEEVNMRHQMGPPFKRTLDNIIIYPVVFLSAFLELYIQVSDMYKHLKTRSLKKCSSIERIST